MINNINLINCIAIPRWLNVYSYVGVSSFQLYGKSQHKIKRYVVVFHFDYYKLRFISSVFIYQKMYKVDKQFKSWKCYNLQFSHLIISNFYRRPCRLMAKFIQTITIFIRYHSIPSFHNRYIHLVQICCDFVWNQQAF